MPDRDPRQVRRRRRPLARRDGPPGPGLPLRRDPDEGRPPAGDEGPQRLEVRARQRRAPRAVDPSAGHRAGRPGPARPARRRGRARPPRAFDGLRLHHRPGGRPRSSSGTSATTTSSWSRSGPTATTRRRTAATASAKAALAIALHVQLRLFAPFLPYVTEEVWSWWQHGLDPPAAPGRPPTSSATHAWTTPPCSTPSPRCWRASAVRSPTAKVGMRTPVEHATITGPASALDAIRSAESDLRAVGLDHRRAGPGRCRGRRRKRGRGARGAPAQEVNGVGQRPWPE